MWPKRAAGVDQKAGMLGGGGRGKRRTLERRKGEPGFLEYVYSSEKKRYIYMHRPSPPNPLVLELLLRNGGQSFFSLPMLSSVHLFAQCGYSAKPRVAASVMSASLRRIVKPTTASRSQ